MCWEFPANFIEAGNERLTTSRRYSRQGRAMAVHVYLALSSAQL